MPIEEAANLIVKLGDEEYVKKFKEKFMVIDIPFSYNTIIERPILYDIGAYTYYENTYKNWSSCGQKKSEGCKRSLHVYA